MNGTLIIARREIVEKKFVFLTALALAVVPFAAALLPVGRTMGARGVILGVSLAVAIAFTLGLAAVLGSSMVGRELSERRLSFYFARPVGAFSVWFGKLGAALFITLASTAIIIAPALFVARSAWNAALTAAKPLVLGGLAAAAVLLLLIAHVISTAMRSRSALLAVDFILAGAAAAAVFFLLRPLLIGMALLLVRDLAIGLLIGLVVAIVAAGAWQLADGRTDRRRSHAAMSRVLWAVIAGVLLAGAGFVTWVVSAKPSDLMADKQFVFTESPRGNWAFLAGLARHRRDYRAGFLYDLSSGRYLRTSGGDISFGQVGFNRAGTMGLVSRPLADGQHAQLVLLPLDKDRVEPVETDLTYRMFSVYVLSDDGQRVAYVEGGLLSVYDLAAKRSLASVRLPAPSWPKMFFVTPDVVRLYIPGSQPGSPERTFDVYELDVPTRALVRTGGISMPANALGIMVSADGSTALVRSRLNGEAQSAIVADPRTLAPLAVYKPAPGVHLGNATLLSDDTVLIPETRGGQAFVRTLRRDGSLIREIPLGPANFLYFSTELPGGKVVLSGGLDPNTDSTTYVVDLGKGVIERREPKLHPSAAVGLVAPRHDPRIGDPAPHLIAAMDEQANIVAWNPATGEKKTIASPRPRS